MDGFGIAFIVFIALAFGLAGGWILRGRRGTNDPATVAQLAAHEAENGALRAQLDQHRDQLRDAMLAAGAERDAQRERDRREAAVLTALSPVQATLTQLHRSVASLERDRQVQFGALAEQLRQANENDEALRQATASLAGALRSTTARGTWGESQLRRIVEASGLTRHVDFDLQVTLTDADGAVGRPDMVVRLPGDKSLAVDAKAPLDAFLRATDLDEADQRVAMRAHAKAVRAHVDALAKREYWSALKSSPEFVVCFLPSEAMLSAALDADAALLDHAFAQRVALASPVSLWSVLKTVAYTWTQEDVSAQAVELFRLGNLLYERLSTLAKHADDLRGALDRAVGAYNRFAGSLESRVLVTARKFPGIDATKVDALTPPALLDAVPRQLSADEFDAAQQVSLSAASAEADPRHDGIGIGAEPLRAPEELEHSPATSTSAQADIGDVRARVFD